MGTNFLAKIETATGNANATILFARIAYWIPKATKRLDGRSCVAKSAEDWCRETGLSYDKYRRAMAFLKGPRCRLVDTKQALFANRNTTHVMLTEAGRELLDALSDGSTTCADTHNPLAQTCTGHLRKPAQLHVQGDTSKKLQTNIGETDLAQSDPETETDHEEGGMKLKAGTFSVKDVQKPSPNMKLHKPDRIASLEHIWKVVVSEVYGDFVPAFTGKQRGQMKHFIARCPPKSAAKVLECVLRDWPGFAQDAAEAAAVKAKPSKPNVDFLLKHVAAAVAFAAGPAEPVPAAPAHSKPSPLQSIAPIKPAKNPDKASYDDVMDILGDDDG